MVTTSGEEKDVMTFNPQMSDYSGESFKFAIQRILTVVYSGKASVSNILRFESANETEMICQGITASDFVSYRRVLEDTEKVGK